MLAVMGMKETDAYRWFCKARWDKGEPNCPDYGQGGRLSHSATEWALRHRFVWFPAVAGQHPIGMGTTVKTPSHGDGIIEDKGGHARPCSIIERIVSPSGKKVPLRRSRIRAAASAGVRFLT